MHNFFSLRTTITLLVVSLPLAISSCGGGGSSSSSTPSASPEPTPEPNQPPGLISPAEVSVIENTQAGFFTVEASDADGDTIQYAIAGGADASLFTLASESGELSFISAPDYEVPGDADSDNVYQIIVSASDGENTAVQQNLTIAVTDINENIPSFTSQPVGTAREGDTQTSYQAAASDQNNGTFAYSISGGADQAFFTINAASGELTFNQAQDFENPADADQDNIYQLVVNVSDGIDGEAQQNVSIMLTDVTSPMLHITFPSIGANAGGASETQVSGLITDSEDGTISEDDITSIIVNDINASMEISENGDYAFWRARVALQQGDNTLLVNALDKNGGNVNSTVQISNQWSFVAPFGSVFEADTNLIYLGDQQNIVAVDLTSGSRNVIASREIGSGAQLSSVRDLALDSNNGRLIISQRNSVLSLNLETGARQIEFDENSAPGANLPDFGQIALDTSGNVAFLSASCPGAGCPQSLLEIDFTDDTWQTIADANTGEDGGEGDNFDIRTIDFDPATDRIIAANGRIDLSKSAPIMEINRSTGDRTFVSGPDLGEGPIILNAVDLNYDAANNRAFLLEPVYDAAVRVDFASGNRDYIFTNVGDPGQVPNFPITRLSQALTYDAQNSALHVIDIDSDRVLSVDVNTGEDTIISEPRVGLGERLRSANSINIDRENNRIVLLATAGVVAIDFDTGDRGTLIEVGSDNAPSFSSPRGQTVLDRERTRLIIANVNQQILLALDLATGSETIIASEAIGTGPSIDDVRGMLYDSANERILFSRPDEIVNVDLASGNRSVLFDNTQISEIVLDNPTRMVLSRDGSTLYLINAGTRSVVTIDMSTGARSILSNGDDFPSNATSITGATSLLLDEDRNRLLLSSNSSSGSKIIAIALDSGDREELSGNRGSGPIFGSATSFAIDSTARRGFLLDATAGQLFMIDLITGDRVINSK